MDTSYQNPRIKSIIAQAIAKANLPKNRYNIPLLRSTEELSGEANDREASDIGVDQERITE